MSAGVCPSLGAIRGPGSLQVCQAIALRIDRLPSERPSLRWRFIVGRTD